jgi:hypothetical protein
MKPAMRDDRPPDEAGSPTPLERAFDWPVCYEAERWLLGQLESFLTRNGFARHLAQRLRDETGTLLLDWTDHLIVPAGAEDAVRQAGFVEDAAPTARRTRAFQHPAALLPRVLLANEGGGQTVAIRVESVLDFLVAHQLSAEPEGAPWSRYRRVVVSAENGAQLEAVERRGYRGFLVETQAAERVAALLRARELWQTRRRRFDEAQSGYEHTRAVLERILDLAGRDLACHVVFEGERAYWQRRNRAAQVQRQRQDALGLGWANHDHHTFRSSRERFLDLMRALERLGFERRERYYAGAQAGWGAQILEQPTEGIVVFADLDLMPEETAIDFSRQPLPPAPRLGTVGLWVGLHGESFLEAGMHHLEARFDFERVRAQLQTDHGVAGLAPFSDFAFLKQAFTAGERWPVRRERAEKLLQTGMITQAEFDTFVAEGAIGSHLETLQRRGGYKGFNQQSVSAIIAATDPRKQTHGA